MSSAKLGAHHAHFAPDTKKDPVEEAGAHEPTLPPHRRTISDQLFKAFDLDGNGAVSLGELGQVLDALKQRRKDGKGGAPVDTHLERQRARWMASVQSQIRQQREQVKRKQSAASFSLKKGSSTVGQIHFTTDVMSGDGDPSLDPDAFAEFIRVFSGKYNEDEFAVFADEMHKAVEDAYQATFGSKQKKLIWELFQLMDVNHDSMIDMKELQLLLKIESKKDKKAIAKWKALLGQKMIDKRRASMHVRRDSGKQSPHGEKAKSSDDDGTSSPWAGSGHSRSAGDVRRKSTFVTGEDGILTIKDEEVTGESDDDHEEDQPALTLKDFQEFLSDFYGNDANKIAETCEQVRAVITDNHKRYLSEMKVDEIVNDIVEDLLRERPHDVLEGISRSVARLRRLGAFPSKLFRSWSTTSHPFVSRSPIPDDSPEDTSPSTS